MLTEEALSGAEVPSCFAQLEPANEVIDEDCFLGASDALVSSVGSEVDFGIPFDFTIASAEESISAFPAAEAPRSPTNPGGGPIVVAV